jgi:hypothetical protein
MIKAIKLARSSHSASISAQQVMQVMQVMQVGTLEVGDPGQVADAQSFNLHQLPSCDTFTALPSRL